MHHVIYDIGRFAVGGRHRSFDAASLIDGYVNNNSAVHHALEILTPNQVWSAGAGNEDRADHQVGSNQTVHDIMPVAEKRGHVLGHDVVQIAKAIEIDIENADVGAQAGGNLGGIGADDAAA